jgi:hypothetical protein
MRAPGYTTTILNHGLGVPQPPARRGRNAGFPPPGTASSPRRKTAPQDRHACTTAQEVVAALTLPAALQVAPQPLSRPPLIDLRNLPRDGSMIYDIGRVDASGRVASRGIVDALRWAPGTRLELVLTQREIIFRSSAQGPFCVPQKSYLILPAHARRLHTIKAGDQLLIAAAPDYDVAIVYPPPALDEMISRYHSTQPAGGTERA